MRALVILSGDGRTRKFQLLEKTLKEIPRVRKRFLASLYRFDPLWVNETASVGVLANAASTAGYLALTEYLLRKRDRSRGRPYRSGRCDLWIADPKREFCCAFEFKQYFAPPGIRQGTFEQKLTRAQNDAKRLPEGEGDHRLGGLILVPDEPGTFSPAAIEHIDSLCATSDISFRVGQPHGPVWFAFREV